MEPLQTLIGNILIFLPLFALAVAALVLLSIFISGEKPVETSQLPYERKAYLFDSRSEFELFKILVELVGEKYYVFPQVHYSHLLKSRKSNWYEERRYRSRIDRKSADFVLCDKEKVTAKLIIELDGSVHNFEHKRRRDEFIDNITKIADLPIIHLHPGNLSKDVVQKEIESKLNGVS